MQRSAGHLDKVASESSDDGSLEAAINTAAPRLERMSELKLNSIENPFLNPHIDRLLIDPRIALKTMILNGFQRKALNGTTVNIKITNNEQLNKNLFPKDVLEIWQNCLLQEPVFVKSLNSLQYRPKTDELDLEKNVLKVYEETGHTFLVGVSCSTLLLLLPFTELD